MSSADRIVSSTSAHDIGTPSSEDHIAVASSLDHVIACRAADRRPHAEACRSLLRRTDGTIRNRKPHRYRQNGSDHQRPSDARHLVPPFEVLNLMPGLTTSADRQPVHESWRGGRDLISSPGASAEADAVKEAVDAGPRTGDLEYAGAW